MPVISNHLRLSQGVHRFEFRRCAPHVITIIDLQAEIEAKLLDSLQSENGAANAQMMNANHRVFS
ncbi:MAG TPA: hypothetical protein DHV53_01140 [Gammaproteobacteria bacterium]|nr:hypothetical protein [Gammaproteobacteria bacterium]HCI87231.1 hypothetical protein [Gammaproteobacteria bacterium]